MRYSIRPIAFRPEWIEALGDIESAIFYQQIHYWSDKGSLDNEWIYKSVADFEFETTLTDRQQRRVVKNLVDRGFIEMELRKAPDGRVTRHFKVVSLLIVGVPLTKGKGSTDEREESSITKSTTKNTQRDIYKSKDSRKSELEEIRVTHENNEIANVIDLFKDINPHYRKLFAQKPQREACRRLIDSMGMEKIINAMGFLSRCQDKGDQYCPVITTPYELEMKLPKLAIHWKKEAKNQKGGVYAI